MARRHRHDDAADRRRLGPSLPSGSASSVIHIAERDTQVSAIPKEPGEFVNTWSIDGFVGEGAQPAELGWGTHERHFPPDGGATISAAARDLPEPAGRLDSRAQLDAARRRLSRLSDHP
jgi:homospermidine synthase